MYGVIYKITNILNGKIYIGQTTRTPQKRFDEHSKADSLLGKDIQTFGKENFSIEILVECQTPEELDAQETFFIEKLNCKLPNGYNTKNGGNLTREYKNDNKKAPISKKDFLFLVIGAKIAYYRTLRQMTQAELAKRANLSKGSIGRIERGKYNKGVPISTLLDIAESLRIDLASLVTFSEEEKKVWWEIDKHML